MKKKGEIVPVEVEKMEVEEVPYSSTPKFQSACITINRSAPVFAGLARDILASKERIQELKSQVAIIKENNSASLQKIKIQFDETKSTIDSINKNIAQMMDILDKLDIQTLDKEGHATYRAILSTVLQMREQVLTIYKSIM